MYMYMCLCMYVCMYVHMCMYMYMNNMFMREQHITKPDTNNTDRDLESVSSESAGVRTRKMVNFSLTRAQFRGAGLPALASVFCAVLLCVRNRVCIQNVPVCTATTPACVKRVGFFSVSDHTPRPHNHSHTRRLEVLAL